MGACLTQFNNPDYSIRVVTGDKRGSGKCKNVKFSMTDIKGDVSPEFTLVSACSSEFSKAKSDKFFIKLPKENQALDDVSKIIFVRESQDFGAAWYVQSIHIHDIRSKKDFVFPVFKWIKPMYQYNITEFDTCLPQNEQNPTQRNDLLEQKRAQYILAVKKPGLPVQAKDIPEDEKFSWQNKWDIFERAAKYTIQNKLADMLSPKWQSFVQLKSVYSKSLPEPAGAQLWKDDFSFARQRTHGCNVGLIKRCMEIPEKLAVDDDMIRMLIERWTITEAIQQKRLFIVDLEILKDVPTKDGCHVCSPIALFYEDTEKRLIPIAIQLEQQPGPDNPVFLPTDPEMTWLMAKMWFNNADAMYHQACAHIGLTHMVMEGIWVSANRQLSQSHPIYKLLAPHFLYLIPMNSVGLGFLLTEKGWIDQTMSIGVKGTVELIRRSMANWRMEMDGNIQNQLNKRGILSGCLTDYPFREDATLIHNITRRYVTKTVNHYYDEESLTKDAELKAWADELVREPSNGGVGIKGMPGNGTFKDNDSLISFLTNTIDCCTIIHAAANFPQYDEYGFPPRYPLILCGRPPKTKDALTEDDLLDVLPDKSTTLRIMTVTRVLSNMDTKSMANYEVTYVFDPTVVKFLKEYRDGLDEASRTIEKRNKERRFPYSTLNPKKVPNSITI